MIKVLIVDDHELIRSGINRLLADADDITVVGEAENGEEGIKLARQLQPDVVLMDINMPGVGGVEATRKILATNPATRVIVVTVFDEEPFPSRMLQIGASGYITKGAGFDELLKAIYQVNQGECYINPEIAKSIALQSVNLEIGESPFDVLSAREMEVLLMVTKGMKIAEIADYLHISSKTVNSYRYRLFDKLNAVNDVELTYLAIRYGVIKLEQIMDSELDNPPELASQINGSRNAVW